jgi:DNA-binding transcriptional MerR regulator/methylmalonyl-CoA mutase cobalamin-binding subunit
MTDGTQSRKAKRPGQTHDAYPVRTVARLTGLSPDLIRAWEKRYGVVAPIRGPRGARLYTTDDVAHLRLLARVVGTGRAIGDIAQLDRPALEALTGTAQAAEPSSGDQLMVARMLDIVGSGDAAALDRQLSEALVALGGRRFVRQLAAPLLTEVGDRWSTGRLSIADEHLLSGTMRGLLVSLIRFREKASGAPTVLLATPSGERHELGLLLVALLTVDAGLGLHYLGPDLPAAEIATAARRADVAVVGLSLVNSSSTDDAVEQVHSVERSLSRHTELWLGGRSSAAVAHKLGATRAVVFDELARVETELARVRAAHYRAP